MTYLFYVNMLCFLIMSFSKLGIASGNYFDYFSAYHIYKFHKLGLFGNGYKVGIIEKKALSIHPALVGKIHIIDGKEPNENSDSCHGTHVSALLLGNKSESFVGGVAC